jgi:membrane protease YdiL (CAAX protease family)
MFDLTNRYDFLGVAILFEGGLVGVAGALGWWFGVDPLSRLSWEGRGVAWGAAATVPMIGFFLVATRLPLGPLQEIKQFLLEALGPSLAACRWYDLLLVAAVAGVGEELLFRGVLHPLAGPVWSNVLFGLAHFITPTYAILAGLLGHFLGWLLDYSENILAPIIAHGLYDFLAFLVVVREFRRNRILQEIADSSISRRS